MKILTVEDDNMIREGISEYLSEFGYTVIQAKDGREALSKFNSDINLVILDIQIPFINGLEVLKEIRKKSNLPILILTAFSDEEYKIDAFTNLVDGYVEKPFSLPVLKARIDALIKKNYGHLEKFEYKNQILLRSFPYHAYTRKEDMASSDGYSDIPLSHKALHTYDFLHQIWYPHTVLYRRSLHNELVFHPVSP